MELKRRLITTGRTIGKIGYYCAYKALTRPAARNPPGLLSGGDSASL